MGTTPNGLVSLWCRFRQAGIEQQPTGLLHFDFRVRSKAKQIIPILSDGDYLFGDPERTRTVDLQRDRLAC